MVRVAGDDEATACRDVGQHVAFTLTAMNFMARPIRIELRVVVQFDSERALIRQPARQPLVRLRVTALRELLQGAPDLHRLRQLG